MTSPIPGVTYPQPRTWEPGDDITVPRLRGDLYNGLALAFGGAAPMLRATSNAGTAVIGHQTIFFNEQQVNTWNVNVVGTVFNISLYAVPFAGYYLAEALNLYGPASSCEGVRFVTGFTYTQNGTLTSSVDGGAWTGTSASAYVCPTATELSQLSPTSGDGIGLYSYQNGTGGFSTGLTATMMVSWVGLPTQGLTDYDGPYGTVVPNPVPAAMYPPGEGTTLSGSISAGAGTITVADSTGMIIGQSLGLGYANGLPVLATAEAVTAGTVTGQSLQVSATAYPHSAGEPVAVPVSAAFLNQQCRDAVNFLSYPPLFRAQQGTVQSVPNATNTQITSLVSNIDTFSGFSSSAQQYTVPVSGAYLVYGQVYFNGVVTAAYYAAGVSVSGTVTLGTSMYSDPTNSAQPICVTIRRIMRLTAGQTIELIGFQSSGASMSTISNTLSTALETSRLIVVFKAF